MKAQRIIIAATLGLLSATPIVAGAAYDGTLWTDLRAQQEHRGTGSASLAMAMMQRPEFEGDLFHRLANAQRQDRQQQTSARSTDTATQGGAGEPLNRLDQRPNVTIYETLAMQHDGHGRS